MGESGPRLVSRAQLSRYTEVSRAAVTTWHKRHHDFPEPVDTKPDLFDLDQVISWLSSRTIPANSRYPHEPVGTTYADRARANLNASGADQSVPAAAPVENNAEQGKEAVRQVQKLLWQALDRLRGYRPSLENGQTLLALLYLCAEHEDTWRNLFHSRAEQALLHLPPEAVAFLPARFPDDLDALKPDVLRGVCQDVALIGTGTDRRTRLATAADHLLALMEKDRHAEILRTPDSVVEVAVGLFTADTRPRHVHDPFCRTGEFLLAAQRSALAGPHSPPLLTGVGALADQTSIAKMNLLIHQVEAEILPEGFESGQFSELPRADIVLTNPPFNMRALEQGERFPYGDPPKSNQNFAWLQHALAMLAPHGRAAVLMPANASFSHNRQERSIRSAMVEDGVVEAVIALPGQLFPTTGIPVNLWVLQRRSGGCSEVLFVDASDLGTMASRTQRELTPGNTDAIRAAYQSWRDSGALDEEQSGLGRVVAIDEIRALDYSLHPPVYVTDAQTEDTQTHARERFEEVTRRLATLESLAPAVDSRVQDLIKEVRQAWTR